jgi:hypothetical protein
MINLKPPSWHIYNNNEGVVLIGAICPNLTSTASFKSEGLTKPPNSDNAHHMRMLQKLPPPSSANPSSGQGSKH